VAVFFSFHYQRDAWRVQQVAQMGAVEGQTLLNAQAWESVRRQGDQAIQNWIDKQMAYKTAVVVLIGAETASRRWVAYEIRKAWTEKRALVGIRIHGLGAQDGRRDRSGPNPFAQIQLKNGLTIANYVPIHDPAGDDSHATYSNIRANLQTWVSDAYRRS
jgi:hypothetical protein